MNAPFLQRVNIAHHFLVHQISGSRNICLRNLIWLPLFFLFGQLSSAYGQCNALQFDGENDYVRATSPINDNSDFTVEMWFRSDDTTSTGTCGSNSLADFRWLIGWDDNNFGIGECHGNLRVIFVPTCPIGTGLCLGLPTVSIQDGAWHHVAFSKNTLGIRVLVDGNLLASFGSGVYNMLGTYRLGSSGNGSVGKNWLGAIDEVRIWNVARSDAQIQSARNCQLAWNEPGLVTLFRGNIGFPYGPNAGLTTLTDLSTSKKDGTLFNFALDGATSNWVSGPDELCDNYCSPPLGEIKQLSPIGEFYWAIDDPRTFVWTNAAGYSGLYRLKIKKLAAGEEAPLKLPDTGLFYDDAAIDDTSFVLPVTVPAFDTLARYAWQVETVGTVGGVKKFGAPVVFNPGRTKVNLTLIQFPTMPLCPGDCFTVTASFLGSPDAFYTNKLTVFSDFSPHVTVNVSPPIGSGTLPAGSHPYPLPIPVTLNAPPHYNYYYNSRLVTICVDKGSPDPIKLSFYYNQSTDCYTNASTCPHDVETRTITVTNVPNYSHLTLNIENPVFPYNNLTEICSGDAIHVCLRDAMGNVPPPGTPLPDITWECSTDGGPFVPVAFSPTNLCFDVLSGVVHADCATSTKGYEDKVYRATIAVMDPLPPHKVCTSMSSEYALRVCCPILTNPIILLDAIEPADALNGTLCEGDEVEIDVSLTNLPTWYSPTNSATTIEWSINNASIPAAAGMTHFSHPVTVGEDDVCISVKMKNCACPEVMAMYCIPVDKSPTCGTISGCDPDLTLVETNPILCYSICPGNAAAVCMDDPTLFDNGTKQWQFSFDPFAATPVWIDLGAGTTIQNTNILSQDSPPNNPLSPYLWPPGQQCIYYRIMNAPLSDPSGCDICYSNLVKICLVPDVIPPVVAINGPNPICDGDVALISVATIQAGVQYTWYCNGLVVGTGPTYSATEAAWYWVEASNGCEVLESNHIFLTVCKVTAAISCPLWPNPCAKFGEEIHLSGCDSKSTCSGTLTYSWTVSSGQPGTTSTATDLCDFYHIPAVNGTTYTLTVTWTNGIITCSDTATTTVFPCQ